MAKQTTNRTASWPDWERVLPWSQGRDAVEARLGEMAAEERRQATLAGYRVDRRASLLEETHRRVVAWSPEEYQQAEELAVLGLAWQLEVARE